MQQFRLKLIGLSVIYAGSIGVFCILAPLFGYPLQFPGESIKVIQQVLPIFIGFLVAGVRFYVTHDEIDKMVTPRIAVLNRILNWCFALFTVMTLTVFLAFGLSGSRFIAAKSGMGIDDLTLLLALLLSLLTGTVGLMVGFAFPNSSRGGGSPDAGAGSV